MDEQGRVFKTYVIVNKTALLPHEIDSKRQDFLNNVGLDVYQALKDFECFSHLSRKHISVHDDDGDISIDIHTCCDDFVNRIMMLFVDYHYRVQAYCIPNR